MIYTVTYPKWIFKVKAINAPSAIAQCDYWLNVPMITITQATSQGMINMVRNG